MSKTQTITIELVNDQIELINGTPASSDMMILIKDSLCHGDGTYVFEVKSEDSVTLKSFTLP